MPKFKCDILSNFQTEDEIQIVSTFLLPFLRVTFFHLFTRGKTGFKIRPLLFDKFKTSIAIFQLIF